MVEIKDLVKIYGKTTALEGISFSVGEGEIVGFLGPNGAGKTTTLNILTGYLSATSGECSIGGIDIFEYPAEAKKLIGYLPEQPPLYPEMKVKEYLNFIYELKKCRLNRKKHLEEIISVTKIGDVSDRIIANLSKGYRQRVGIAQTLIGNPPVIIFDEPTVGLDPRQVIEIRNLIRNLGKSHTVIFSSHILSEVQSVCDRIVIINEGRIVADESASDLTRISESEGSYNATICGPKKDVIKAVKEVEGVKEVEDTGVRDSDSVTLHITSKPGIDIRKPLFYMLSSHSWPLIGLESAGLSLEDFFVSITEKDSRRYGKKNTRQ